MVILCAGVEINIIHLIDFWKLDYILRNIHLHSNPTMKGFTEKMLQHIKYTPHLNPKISTLTPRYWFSDQMVAPSSRPCPYSFGLPSLNLCTVTEQINIVPYM